MFGGNQIMRLSSWIYRIVRWGLGGIFIYSGATKLLAPQIFAVLIDAYGIVPDRPAHARGRDSACPGSALPVSGCFSTSAAVWP